MDRDTYFRYNGIFPETIMYISIIFTIGVIILIHEAGHFFAARAAGIPVERFSIGFGPKLWRKKTASGTEFALSAIPIGGYLLPAVSSEAEWFIIPVRKRILLSAGGPAANLIAALVTIGAVNLLRGNVSFYAAAVAPFEQLWGIMTSMVTALPKLFSQPDQLSGIVGIVAQGGAMVEGSMIKLLKFSIIININLAVLNLLPLPALDGGKILLNILEALHPRLRSLQMPLSLAGWFAIIGLMVYVTVLDIGKLM